MAGSRQAGLGWVWVLLTKGIGQMKLTTREVRYLKKLMKHEEWVTKYTMPKENKLAASILNKIEIDEVLKNWDKE